MLIPSLPSPLPVAWLKKIDIHAIGPVKVEDFDYTHTSIYIQETMRTGIGGPKSALTAGLSYGLPPILKFGSPELQERFVPGILKGDVRVCIAITEPDAGSDVAGVTTTAKKTEDGKKYVVNGTKKWVSAYLIIVNSFPANSALMTAEVDYERHLVRLCKHVRSDRWSWAGGLIRHAGSVEGSKGCEHATTGDRWTQIVWNDIYRTR